MLRHRRCWTSLQLSTLCSFLPALFVGNTPRSHTLLGSDTVLGTPIIAPSLSPRTGKFEGGGRLAGPGVCDCTSPGVSCPGAVQRWALRGEVLPGVWGCNQGSCNVLLLVLSIGPQVRQPHGVTVSQPVREEPKGKRVVSQVDKPSLGELETARHQDAVHGAVSCVPHRPPQNS